MKRLYTFKFDTEINDWLESQSKSNHMSKTQYLVNLILEDKELQEKTPKTNLNWDNNISDHILYVLNNSRNLIDCANKLRISNYELSKYIEQYNIKKKEGIYLI